MPVPVLTIKPEFIVDVTDEYDVAMADPASPVIQRAPNSPKDRRVWEFRWRNGRRADKDALVALNDAVVGGAARFLYQPPDQIAARELRMVEDSFTWRKETAVKYSMSFAARDF